MVQEIALSHLSMGAELSSRDWEGRRVQEWLLLLLRFAITLAPSDRSAAVELDSSGALERRATPRFFVRTSHEVCEAILSSRDRHNAVLRRHIARIEHPRLRQAFQAAVGLLPPSKSPARRAKFRNKSDTNLRNRPPKR
jgi:hypothetical protein